VTAQLLGRRGENSLQSDVLRWDPWRNLFRWECVGKTVADHNSNTQGDTLVHVYAYVHCDDTVYE
jgi:hypothetical protein